MGVGGVFGFTLQLFDVQEKNPQVSVGWENDWASGLLEI